MPSPDTRHIPKFDLVFPVRPPQRRWFSFTLRNLFVITTLVAVGIAVTLKYLRDTKPMRQRFDAAKQAARLAAAEKLTGIEWVTAVYGEGETIVVMGYGYDKAGKRSRFRYQSRDDYKNLLTVYPAR